MDLFSISAGEGGWFMRGQHMETNAVILHYNIPIEHADDVNKLFVIPRVVVSLAILSLLSATISQQYTMKRFPCAL